MQSTTSTPRLLAGHVATLRKGGLRSPEVLALQQIAVKMKRQRITICRGSYLAQMLGVSTSYANRLLRRLAALGLITRFKTGLMRLNFENVSNFNGAAVNRLRRKASKWLKQKAKSARVNRVVHIEEKINKPNGFGPSWDRVTALGELKATYIPLHLRKNRA